MRRAFIKRIISFAAAAVLAAAHTSSVYADNILMPDGDDLRMQSLELYPHGEESEQMITLEGMMPEGAEAAVFDVSDDYVGIAAYDISISDGDEDFQPNEENPILVEITDPVIPENGSVELWHIQDNGVREQIEEFTVEDGKISFYATGFSVYEIVKVAGTENQDLANVFPKIITEPGWHSLTNSSNLAAYNGILISSSGGYFMTNNKVKGKANSDDTALSRNCIQGTASSHLNDPDAALTDGAARYYFEASGTNYKVFCYDSNNEKQYLKSNSGSLTLVSGTGNATQYTVNSGMGLEAGGNRNKIQFEEKGKPNNNQPDNVFVTGGSAHNLTFWYYNAGGSEDDPFHLDSTNYPDISAYGLMAYTDGNMLGNALMADANLNYTRTYGVEVTGTAANSTRQTLHITENTDITEWRFTWVEGDKYKLYDAASRKYLKSNGTALSIVDNEADATAFQVLPQEMPAGDNRKKIQLKDLSSSKYVSFSNDSFVMSNTPTDLWFVKNTEIGDDQRITYTADRVSVSDGERACDGQEIILYTRIWNEDKKHYDFYAVDYNGQLVRCYAYGDKLMWMGDAVNTLVWKLIVHKENDRETGYYDLQNRYSGKYLNPQFPQHNETITTVNRPGLLLPGRNYEVTGSGAINYGEYYTSILSWDYGYYNYAALDNDGTTKTVSSAMAYGDDYYFAVFDSAQDEHADQLHEVVTVDNSEYGITMKMVDFNGTEKKYTGCTSTEQQHNVMGVTKFESNPQQTGLLTTNLADNGNYPTATHGENKSLGELFSAAELTNHLFIQSIHDSSGYFEFDSTQNFATLGSKDHSNRTVTQYLDNITQQYTTSPKDENGNDNTPVYDFTVYRELGSHTASKDTLRHGQFFPYNTITAGKHLGTNQNLYTVDASIGNMAAQGKLPDDDPRKGENLYDIGNADCYFGIELGARFVQTPSGLDAWGHDVIFEFTGDDDFWLYVDGELIIDLGGVHSALGGKVNFRTGEITYSAKATAIPNSTLKEVFYKNYKSRSYTADELALLAKKYCMAQDPDGDYSEFNYAAFIATPEGQAYLEQYPDRREGTTHTEADAQSYVNDIFVEKDVVIDNGDGTTTTKPCWIFRDYTEHTMKIFYMERGGGASNLHMRFNLSSVTPGNVQFEKKFVSTDGSDLSRTDFGAIQFPIQIRYKKDVSDKDWLFLTDKAEDNTPSVSYQSSTQTVQYAAEYKSPNAQNIYKSVFFVTPGKPLEINFPDEAMLYQIVECAVNREIYNVRSDSVVTHEDGTTGNVEFTESDEDVIAQGNIKDLIMTAQMVKELPAITLTNEINPNSIQSLNITKKLYAGKSKTAGSELFYSSPGDETREDKTTFNYRLYLSNGTGGTLQLASLREYYVLDPSYKVCFWDHDLQQFVPYTNTEYPDGLLAYQVADLSDEERVNVTSNTSPYGSISNIPAGYTVHVPGLLAGTKFMVVERDYEIPVGYQLIDYYSEKGYQISDDEGKFKLKEIPLEWTDPDNPDETKLLAVYKGTHLLSGYAKEYTESSAPAKASFEFDRRESQAAVSEADQYQVYDISVTKHSDTSVDAFAADGQTLTVSNYAWGSAAEGDSVTLAVYDHEDRLIPDKMMELVYPETTAVFTFNQSIPNLSDYHVYKVNIQKNQKLTCQPNVKLISSFEKDSTYTLNGTDYYSAVPNSAGTILSGVDAKVTVNNCRGFGIRANKIWSDADFTTAHDRIFTAVYLDDIMVTGTVKCLESPNTTVQYFFDSLPTGKHLSNYGIYEVELTNPTFDANGNVTGYSNLRRLERISDNLDDKKISVDVSDRLDTFTLRVLKRWEEPANGGETPSPVTVGIFDSTSAETPVKQGTLSYPTNELKFHFDTEEDTVRAAGKYLAYEIRNEIVDGVTKLIKGARLDTEIIPDMLPQEYTVSYTGGTPYKTNDNVGEENARTDTIRNTRKGGIEINLYEWNNTNAAERPLEGGSFQLYEDVTDSVLDANGNILQTDEARELYRKCTRFEMTEIAVENGTPAVVQKPHFFKLINTYVSDSTGNVTVLYNIEPGSYMLRQTVAPLEHVGISEMITFDIDRDNTGAYTLKNWVNLNDVQKDSSGHYILTDTPDSNGNYSFRYLDDDTKHPTDTPPDNRNWAEYDVQPASGALTAKIDIYNKTYTFDIKKVKSGTNIALPGAWFKLYREVMTVSGYVKDKDPLPGYDRLISATGTGLIPKIDNTLAQGTYYLKEEQAPDGYVKMEQDICFSVTENGIVVHNGAQFGEMQTTNSLDGSHVTYVISVPNTRAAQTPEPEEYYFSIRKTILLDKYMHERGDAEQTFLFKVERFELTDTLLESPVETFYVPLNCNDVVDDSFTIADSDMFSYDRGTHKVTVSYNTDQTYSFPADIRRGTQHVCAKKKGIFRITEVSGWSGTDYAFWKGSNTVEGSSDPARPDGTVVLTINNAGEMPVACFTNSETQYAYLTSQAWAKNTITNHS